MFPPTEMAAVIRSSIVMRTFLQLILVFLIPGLFGRSADARQQTQVTITGVIVDAETGAPVSAANVELNGNPAGTSDQNGRFRIETPLAFGTTHRLVATRIGYQRAVREFVIQEGNQNVDIIFHLVPVPVRLRDINVEGEAQRMSVANLAGFNRRRQNSPGHFFTREAIQRIGAQRLTEVVRRVPGSIIYSPDNVNPI